MMYYDNTMETISFKISPEEARIVRERARQEHLTLSEFLRRQAVAPPQQSPAKVQTRVCQLTGATIFDAGKQLPPLTVESTRDMLTNFP